MPPDELALVERNHDPFDFCDDVCSTAASVARDHIQSLRDSIHDPIVAGATIRRRGRIDRDQLERDNGLVTVGRNRGAFHRRAGQRPAARVVEITRTSKCVAFAQRKLFSVLGRGLLDEAAA